MAWVNDSIARSLKITVTKYIGGNTALSYPHTYDGQNSWGDPLYPTLTDIAFKQLTTAEFEARYAAFKLYVESVEAGLDFETSIIGDGASKYSEDCVTTTAAPDAVYAFSVKYAQYAVDVCSGSETVLYSNKAIPVVGDTLYKDVDMTLVWNTAKYVLFVSPYLNDNYVMEVSTTTGKILWSTGFQCGTSGTPVTVYPITVNLATTINGMCAAGITTQIKYTTTGFLTPGLYLYENASTKVVGYSYVRDTDEGVSGEIFNLSTDGLIGESTTLTCNDL